MTYITHMEINSNKETIFSTFRNSKTVFEFIGKMMELQNDGTIILKTRGASNTRELGNLFYNLEKRNLKMQHKTTTLKLTHYSKNETQNLLNYETLNLTLPYPFTILKKENHPSGKPSLYIYTIQHNLQTI